MSGGPTPAELEALRAFDTPTICNALEVVAPQRRGYGYTLRHLHCLFPDMKPIVGYARTATMRARQPPRYGPEEYMDVRAAYFDYVAAGPGPKVSVVQDLDERPGYGAFWGEVFSAVHKALGCRGAVTNGSVRDVDMLAPGFQVLAGLVAPSHAFVHAVDWGCEVDVQGMVVQDGDLVHADRHGAVVVPADAVAALPEAVDLLMRREAVILEAARDPACSVDRIKEAWRRSVAIRK